MGAISQEKLSAALFGKARRAVLGLLFGRPDESFYLRQVVRLAGAGQGAVQRELARLSEADVITKRRRGRQVYYRVNRKCPIYAELKGLMTKTAGLADVLRESLAPLADRIELAFIYGSQASDTAGAASDADLLIVGDVEELAIHRALAVAEERLARSVNYSLLDRREFERRRKETGGFLARVLSGDKIFIVGSPDDV